MPRIKRSHVQSYQVKLSALIGAVNLARTLHGPSMGSRPTRQMCGLSRFVKDLLALPASSDLSPLEVNLKRRLVRLNRRLVNGSIACLSQDAAYVEVVWAYTTATQKLLARLADVDIKKDHQHIKKVSELMPACQ